MTTVILQRGSDAAIFLSFCGGGNAFNEFEDRKLVFFGDTIDKELIAQGTDVQRQAAAALKEHSLQAQFRELRLEATDLGAAFLDRCAEIAAEQSRTVEIRGYDRNRIKWGDASAARFDYTTVVRDRGCRRFAERLLLPVGIRLG